MPKPLFSTLLISSMLLLVFSMPTDGLCQSTAFMDSVWQVQKDTSKPDTIRLKALGRYAYLLYRTDSARADYLFDSLISETVTRKLAILEVRARNTRYTAYIKASEYERALKGYESMLGILEKSDNKPGIGSALYGKGLALYYLGRYQESIQWQEKTRAFFIEIDDQPGLYDVYNNMASSYMLLGNYPGAIESYLMSRQIAEELSDTGAVVQILGNMGMVYKQMQKFEEAKSLYMEAKMMAMDASDSFQLAFLEQQLGTVLDNQDSTRAALDYYIRAMKINEAIQNQKGITENIGNIGIAYYYLQQWDSAWTYLNQAVELNEAANDRRNTALVKDQIGNLLTSADTGFLRSIGHSVESAQERAIIYHQEALAAFVQMGYSSGHAGSLESLAKIYNARGQHEKGFSMLMELIAINDSIFTDDTKEKVLETEMRYQQAQKEALLKAEHEAELRQQRLIRYALALGSLLVLASAGVIFFFYQRKKAAKAELDQAQLMTSLAKMENKALRSQMNPHFIFNALNSIAYYVRTNEGTIADDYLSKFAKLMRKVLENSEKGEVSLTEDMETLQLYLQLEQLRTRHKFEFKIEIDPAIDAEEVFIPPLLLQPFVENSIWHGIMPKAHSGSIDIQVSRSDGFLECRVTDNGVGISQTRQAALPEPAKERKSLGMKITGERLELLEKQVGKTGRFELISLAEGTMAKIFIPLVSEESMSLTYT